MVILCITHRTVSAYRHSFFVGEKIWITTQTPLYYLDLAVPSQVLFKKHFEKVFPKYKVETGQLRKRNVRKRKRRFFPDDISVGGREGRRDSNLFYLYAMSRERNVDKLELLLFLKFLNSLNYHALPLTSGKKAVMFLNLVELIGYQQWKEISLLPLSLVKKYCESSRNLLIEEVFIHIYFSIIKGIEEMKSEHPFLLKKFWDLFCTTERIRITLFVKVPDAEHLKFMLEVANSTQFDFWGFRYGVNEFSKCVIARYLDHKRYDLLTLLLDYGFPLGEIFLCGKDCLCHKPLTHLFLKFDSKEFLPNRFMVWFLVRCYDSCRNPLDVPGFMELYQKLSRSLPLPSQPHSMVREYLEKALEQAPSSTTAVEEMTAIYEATDVHPSDCSVVAPQKLSQLSRCVLREALSANYHLPTAVSDSHLPTLVKRFLSLEC